ncbi:tail fiber assembly protein [uncultured Gilliamella sp.]|uniref:tail fiber assembly protein n=1 Tax=uncultured Gilliamella sp. TaxID=1193505 RepID=UPI0025E598A8|nr:tail fiber assembly protein [uncultured Gilliamella sp.]
MINYYFDNTNELKPYTHQLDANDDTLPPDNALRVKPEFKEGFHPCEKNGEWIQIEDHRDKTVYNIETQEASKIEYLGSIKENFTQLEPFQFSKWNGKKWVLDEDEQNAFKIKQNKMLKNSLLNEANENISILQDAIDLNMSEDGDEEKLKAWKKYRILINRIDVSNIPLVFPEKP